MNAVFCSGRGGFGPRKVIVEPHRYEGEIRIVLIWWWWSVCVHVHACERDGWTVYCIIIDLIFTIIIVGEQHNQNSVQDAFRLLTHRMQDKHT